MHGLTTKLPHTRLWTLLIFPSILITANASSAEEEPQVLILTLNVLAFEPDVWSDLVKYGPGERNTITVVDRAYAKKIAQIAAGFVSLDSAAVVIGRDNPIRLPDKELLEGAAGRTLDIRPLNKPDGTHIFFALRTKELNPSELKDPANTYFTSGFGIPPDARLASVLISSDHTVVSTLHLWPSRANNRIAITFAIKKYNPPSELRRIATDRLSRVTVFATENQIRHGTFGLRIKQLRDRGKRIEVISLGKHVLLNYAFELPTMVMQSKGRPAYIRAGDAALIEADLQYFFTSAGTLLPAEAHRPE
ncbi:hypothetical protein [Stratiformator vulcanicus]|uniref:Uncharacterized protein n=1 Tax=Stratiformator vulcanicus TaxID=2527980 RepID=A0A517R608_9PLAN|nr:hypothetical protein [Stratiformator vulcanicus]QDT39336.1 hypothetical protein Pan189_37420 [Stratiformator vulcanicus]